VIKVEGKQRKRMGDVYCVSFRRGGGGVKEETIIGVMGERNGSGQMTGKKQMASNGSRAR
jgi:hypothetical protein